MIAVAWIAGLAGTWLARRGAWRLAIIDRPNPIVPQHQRPVAHLGGLGIAIGTACGLACGRVTAPPSFAIGAAGYLILGTLDDIRPLRPLAKLVAQLALAIAIVAIARPSASPLVLASSALWIALVVNAVNLTDVCDGLVGSLAAVALIAHGLATGGSLGFVLAGATAGFLWFNRAPATIFLGDGGSHLLGFALGYLWLGTIAEQPDWNHGIAAVLDVGVFVLELGFLVIVRSRRGLAFWRGSPDHLALRLQAAGFSKQHTVGIALIPALGFGGLAIWLVGAASPIALALALILAVALVVLVTVLYGLEPEPRLGRPREARSSP